MGGRRVDIQYRSRYLKHIQAGKLGTKISANGMRVLGYHIHFQNTLLNVHKDLSAPGVFLLQHKVDMLMAQWDLKCDEHVRRSKIAAGQEAADQQTIEASATLERLSSILTAALKVDDRVDWDALKDHSKFQPSSTFREPAPSRERTDKPLLYEPEIGFFDRLLSRVKSKKEAALNVYKAALADWERREAKAAEKTALESAAWMERRRVHALQVERERSAFLQGQADANAKVDQLAENVAVGDAASVVEHVSLVLDASDYNELFEKSYALEYRSDTKTLLLEYQLPSPDEMPTLKSVRFYKGTGEMRETHISEREQKANYDFVCYQISLRTLHELFEADVHGNLDQILFNGIATFIDRTSGKEVTSTIMSLMVNRSAFVEIDLARVDPKACFKSMKGVSASSLSALVPIEPVIKFDKDDRRFVDARSAVEHLEETTNLAAMDWEDFEHLVREVFEKEFSRRGGEVKITQSSRDGGVDAVAFDPDPFTGGKIVIQAKRYTKTVGVSAVRDLYGTMLHEKASRGILVTTADYGPDAYQFSSEKHITLMTGSNLLHLLERHGIAAKIDLREARAEMNLRDYGR